MREVDDVERLPDTQLESMVDARPERMLLKRKSTIQNEGSQLDVVTFSGVLTACSHAGLVKKGLKYFKAMKGIHRIAPRIEYCRCIVDLYSCTGRVENALGVIKNILVKPNKVILESILIAGQNLSDAS
ncbi:hypothetical protein T459_03027 [Capsicum annuum]|uniref:Pentatricopeptide repeat-containing protein n=1 Tax=Capsicum annuum TaxID=4072 RepID=A0A2G3ALM9_CAPAN|nr:hypothetical protein FXO37_35871 [Capsicum annuum]PHT95145.1 hypothetical protein T459_03027 [Capsicum annuum]